MIDIDHFKAFNDRLGHAAGDTMIKSIVSEITAAARYADVTYRYGGEEIVVIADGIAGGEAFALGERIRGRVAGALSNEPTARVTISTGVASCPRDGVDYDTLF